MTVVEPKRIEYLPGKMGCNILIYTFVQDLMLS